MSESALKAKITEAMKDAMRAKAKERLGTIRLIQADIKRIEVDERIELDDARVLQTLGYSAVRDQATRKIPKAVIQSPRYLRHERLGWNYRMSEVTAAIVLGQVERASGLVAVRARAAQAIEKVLKDVPWLTSQAEYPKSKSSYWSKAYKLDLDFCSWETFYATFLGHGGRGVYAAWALGYQEPAFKNLRLQGRELVLTRPVEELYVPGTTPIAEDLQQRILAFRTNEWNPFALAKQMAALRKTVAELNQI
jgi:dTDP-4-amino-4,6-dideoxygalactose transaminase